MELKILILTSCEVLIMALKIPPAIVFLFFVGMMYLLALWLPVGYYDFLGRNLLVKILTAGAVLIAVISLFQFYRAKTSINPHDLSKTTSLVTKGIYNYTRNPMYLAMLLLLLAWGLWLGNAFNTLLAAAFVAYMNAFQIKREEESLRKQFGKDYEQYCRFVRRWF